jgi:hypothetical protein
MERYKNYLIQATARGEDSHWEPWFTIYNADGRKTEVLKHQALLVHEKTHPLAIERAVAAAKKCINEEM